MSKPLILLHGALGSTDQFNNLTPLLADACDVHAFNFSGHGGGESTELFTMDLFVQGLDGYMTAQGLTNADLFGYSMGGYVALLFAAKYPDKVDKVMTLGTKFHWTPASAAEQVKLLDPNTIEAKVPHFAQALAERHHPHDWKEVVQKTADMMVRLGNGEAVDFSQLDIQQEVVIAVGDLDRMVTFDEALTVAKTLPKARFEPLPGVPHPIEQVDAGLLAGKIVQFLATGG